MQSAGRIVWDFLIYAHFIRKMIEKKGTFVIFRGDEGQEKGFSAVVEKP